MSKGIYCYIDKKNNKIVYIGKDSHIDKDRRKRQHMQPSNANSQPFNKILRVDKEKLQQLVDYINDGGKI